MSLFSDLVNSKKIGKITSCTLQIPELSKEALKITRLTRKQFAKLLEKYIAIELKKALSNAPLVHSTGTFNFTKVNLDYLVETKL